MNKKNLIKILLLIISIVGILIVIFGKSHSSSIIIIVNGPSSSGKSSIAEMLENKLDNSFIKIGADAFSLMLLPKRFVNYDPEKKQPNDPNGLSFIRADGKHPKLIAKAGPYACNVFGLMPQVVKTIAKAGNNVIVDAGITITKEWLDSFVKNLSLFKVYFIKVYAPLEVLEKREKERHGLIGLARGQLESMELIEKSYKIPFDFIIDTSKLNAEKSAQEIISFVKNNPSPRAFKIIGQTNF